MEYFDKVEYTRTYCRKNHIRYRIKGADMALFLYAPTIRKYVQKCYSLYNIGKAEDINAMIEHHVWVFGK